MIAQQLDIGLVAEGVENELQAEFIRCQGCDMVQGYLHARPMTADDFLDWCRKRGAAGSGAIHRIR